MTELQFTSDIGVQLIDRMGDDYSIIQAAKVSVWGMKAAREGIGDQFGFINYLMRNRHGSPFEHGAMTFRIHAPIFVFREWHRHRVGWSYNEESARYREMEPLFYIPPNQRPLRQEGKPGHYRLVPGLPEDLGVVHTDLSMAYTVAYQSYKKMLEVGIAREIARACLPVGIYSSMYATCNPRSLMHFLSLRTFEEMAAYPSHPQWEIEQAARAMEDIFSQHYPLTYNTFIENGRVAP